MATNVITLERQQSMILPPHPDIEINRLVSIQKGVAQYFLGLLDQHLGGICAKMSHSQLRAVQTLFRYWLAERNILIDYDFLQKQTGNGGASAEAMNEMFRQSFSECFADTLVDAFFEVYGLSESTSEFGDALEQMAHDLNLVGSIADISDFESARLMVHNAVVRKLLEDVLDKINSFRDRQSKALLEKHKQILQENSIKSKPVPPHPFACTSIAFFFSRR